MQKGPVGLPDDVLLRLADLVPLLGVGDSPGLLDLAQLFKAIIEALATETVVREATRRQMSGGCCYNRRSRQWRDGAGSP